VAQKGQAMVDSSLFQTFHAWATLLVLQAMFRLLDRGR
jgi:hypothetical protein